MMQRQWVARALEGDRDAKAQLFEQTIQPIYYLCWKLTGSAAQASDVTRRTFARAFSHLNELRPDAGFDRWVIAIAVNLCRQTMKKMQPGLFMTNEREMAALRDTYVAPEECLPPDCLLDPERRAAALHLVVLLPPEQRVCMVLRYVALLKPHQIAKTMDVDEVTVLGRLNSARYALVSSLSSPAPQALLSQLFAQEAAALPVPELLRESCMQTVLETQPETPGNMPGYVPGNAPGYVPGGVPGSAAGNVPPQEADEGAEELPEEREQGFLSSMNKQQKTLLFGGAGLALVLVIIILLLVLRGCGAKKPTPETPETPEPAPVEEINQNTEAAAKLDEYGVEMLLTCSRRDAQELIESWQTVLPDYVTDKKVESLELTPKYENDAVTEVRLRLEKTDLNITRLRDLGLGSQPELDAAAKAITAHYKLHCYEDTPLFDPEPREDHSVAAYSEYYRYELIDENDDGRAEVLCITKVGAGFDAETGVFRPYGESLSTLLGMSRDEAEAIMPKGDYEGDSIEAYSMELNGAAEDNKKLSIRAIMQARSDIDAARQSVSALVLRVNGCFAELLPELQLPDSTLTLENLERKLQALSGHLGWLEGDVFAPLTRETGKKSLTYYDGTTRYFFSAAEQDARVESVEVLDLSDCRLWDAASTSFRKDGFDLEKLLGLTKYEAYAQYGIRQYSTPDGAASALGLYERSDCIRTVDNAADSRLLWGIALNDTRTSIEKKVEDAKGYCCEAGDEKSRYVLPDDRELLVTYSGEQAMGLKLEDHSDQADYQAPKPLRKSPQEQYQEFLSKQTDVKASWYGDLTHDGVGDLLICRASGAGCLLQLYVLRDGELNETPIYTQTVKASDATDVYLVSQDDGAYLLLDTRVLSMMKKECRWRLMSVNEAGGEVVLKENAASVNAVENLFGDSTEYDAVVQEAQTLSDSGTFFCGTQSGDAKYSEQQAQLEG